MPKAYERADAVVDAGHAAMRNRHAVTQAGTAELFACREAAKDIAGIEVAGACQQLRQLLKRLLLAGEGMPLADAVRGQIGRASGRERVCQYVEISVGAGSLQNRRYRVSTITYSQSK